MRKLLFITFANKLAYTGGGQGAQRNLKGLQAVLGAEHVISYIIQPEEGKRGLWSKIKRMRELSKYYMGALNDQALSHIIKLLEREQCTDLFIDSSQLGLIAKVARERFPMIHIYTFFQNIEYDFMYSNITKEKDYLHAFWIPLVKYNENCACQYSDKLVVFNNRDAKRLNELYQRQPDYIIPITMIDNYTDDVPNVPIDHKLQKKGLFVGSYFFGNTAGLKWFCHEVLPFTDIHLTIVGSGMRTFANDIPSTRNISIYSDVPNLTPFFEQADFMILPITAGGGMKVKTAEGLKYGKYIIGTPEALEGYEVDDSIATICKTKEDFIQAIKNFNKQTKYCAESRQLFKQKYSFESSIHLFKQMLQI